MGTFEWPIVVGNLDRSSIREIEAMVDTGATYTVLPSALLAEIGIEATRKAEFEFADGTLAELNIGQAWVSINGESVITQVVFGEDDTSPLLGAYTLEGLLLAVDPFNQRLVPTHAIWY